MYDQTIRNKKLSETNRKKFENSIKHVDLEELRRLYLDKDWSYEQIRQHYNLTGYTLDKILRENGFKKPRSQSCKKGLETKYTRAGSKEEYYKQLHETTKRRIEEKGTTWEEHCKQVSNSCKDAWKKKSPQEVKLFLNSVREHYWSIPEKLEAAKKKRVETNLKKYGVDNTYKLSNYVSDSVPNKLFGELLTSEGIDYVSEFYIQSNDLHRGFRYDFLIEKTLVELDPWPFHNSTWSPIDKSTGLDKNYHFNKTKSAIDAGYRCIHVWDWDNVDKIISSLKPKRKIFARNCDLRIVPENIVNEFLNTYHFQNTCRGQQFCYGLYENNELVQLMTFGRARYNCNYQYELLRLCTRNDVYVVGGAEKLFKHFIRTEHPESIISYCDNSKFSGDVYKRLGMIKLSNGSVTRHWFNPELEKHVTDNLLRQRGFDQLFGDEFGCYGKGTSNTELMIQHGFVEVYDCGQSVFTWNR